MTIELTSNGEAVTPDAEPDMPLPRAIRVKAGVTHIEFGRGKPR